MCSLLTNQTESIYNKHEGTSTSNGLEFKFNLLSIPDNLLIIINTKNKNSVTGDKWTLF